MSQMADKLIELVKEEIAPKEFSTGSKGFFANDKITVDGNRYQAQARAVLIGSKDDPKAKVQATPDEITAALAGLIEDELDEEKVFSSGRTGAFAQGKFKAHDQRFQASAQAVLLDK